MCARLSGSSLKSIASFDLGFCSWTRAYNLGVTERPAQFGGRAGVGIWLARSGAGGEQKRGGLSAGLIAGQQSVGPPCCRPPCAWQGLQGQGKGTG